MDLSQQIEDETTRLRYISEQIDELSEEHHDLFKSIVSKTKSTYTNPLYKLALQDIIHEYISWLCSFEDPDVELYLLSRDMVWKNGQFEISLSSNPGVIVPLKFLCLFNSVFKLIFRREGTDSNPRRTRIWINFRWREIKFFYKFSCPSYIIQPERLNVDFSFYLDIPEFFFPKSVSELSKKLEKRGLQIRPWSFSIIT